MGIFVVRWGLLTAFLLCTLFPFYWMLITSLKPEYAVVEFPPKLVPTAFEWRNYVRVFELMPMVGAYWNSLKVTGLVTAGTLLTSSMAAFAFAKLRFPASGLMFTLLLSTMMVPAQVKLIPLYIVFAKLGWINTHLPLWVPTVLLNAYGVFMIRQFMYAVPRDYLESAKIDGCGYFRIYWQIMLPLSKPILMTLGLFTFVWSWNSYIDALIFLNTEAKFTVPLIVASFRGLYEVKWELLMSASTVSMLPIVGMYLFTQRYFIQSIAMSGLKG
jgi:multiple sugar transport system permease protein